MDIQLGSAPSAFGVRHPDDPLQMPWPRFLDEVAAAGYRVIELGPPGYLPTDGDSLVRELEQRNLKVSAAGVQFPLGEEGAFERHKNAIEQRCALLRHVGASYVVLLDAYYTDRDTGEPVAAPELEESAWNRLIEICDQVADLVKQYGLRTVFHPHADTHVEYEAQIERLLAESPIGLCFDVGHHAYRGGDPIEFVRRHHRRVEYLHLQDIDGDLQRVVQDNGLPFVQAAERGMFVEPWRGEVDFVALRSALTDVDYDGYAIVEQGMYPCPLDKPFPIAKKTYEYLTGLGIG